MKKRKRVTLWLVICSIDSGEAVIGPTKEGVLAYRKWYEHECPMDSDCPDHPLRPEGSSTVCAEVTEAFLGKLGKRPVKITVTR